MFAIVKWDVIERRAGCARDLQVPHSMFFAMIQFKPVAGGNASSEWGLQHDTKLNFNMFVPAAIALR